jgi:CheY-like chemotaxis protein
MNGVLGMASLLQGTELTWEQREYVETIRTSAEALLTVINDILDLSKIEAGRIDIEEIGFDLRKTMEEASGLLMPQARVKGLELACHYPPELPSDFRGDPGRIRQVLLNLGGNAVKFTERGRVVLEARPIRVGEDRVTVRLQVDDTGIGIAPEKLAVVFDSFTQADSSTTRRYGGTGLGLTVSRRLVELMDGRIGVESERGRGSSFWFELDLPRHAPTAADSPAGGSPAPAAATTAKQPPLPGVRVLLVEDNVVNQRVARKMLEQLGCSVSVVGNGHEAVMAASPRMHDVILMDCQMPVLDGYEATAAIRRAEESTGARVPIIAMTAHAMEGDRAKCLGAGMDDYMAKPIRPPELLQMLQKWCPGGEIERAA